MSTFIIIIFFPFLLPIAYAEQNPYHYFLIKCCIGFFCGCKKHTSKPAVEQLPAVTQYGANTFGCLVNGKVFVPKAKFGNMHPILTCYYQYIYSDSPEGYVFQVAATDNSNPSSPVEVNIILDSLHLASSKTYKLQTPFHGNAAGYYRMFTNGLLDIYSTYSPYSGELTINRFDETYQVVIRYFLVYGC